MYSVYIHVVNNVLYENNVTFSGICVVIIY